MSPKAEHAKAPGVIRIIELVGVSDKSWSDAAQQAIARAAKTLRHITGADVVHSRAVVRDGKIVEYRVDLKLAFIVEPAEIEA
jgi:flavin-binding protein dodecin